MIIWIYIKLKELDQLKDDFISMASHELRTPLTIISGYAEFLNEDKNYQQKIENIYQRFIFLQKVLKLVADMLDVSKIEQGKMSFKMEKVNPSEIINTVVSSFILSTKEKGLNIYFDKTEIIDDQFINIDIEHFKQILVNLIGNAIKYTIKGEIIVKQYREKNTYI